MNRKEFLKALRDELRKRRDIEVEEVIFYYDELIQDAVDNGENEIDFINKLGNIREIVRKIVDDESFLVEMREKNRTVVKSALGTTIKIFSYCIFGFVAFIIIVTAFSILVSGLALVIKTIITTVANSPSDFYGYLMMLGYLMVGVSLTLISIGLVLGLINRAKPTMLSIIRKIRN